MQIQKFRPLSDEKPDSTFSESGLATVVAPAAIVIAPDAVIAAMGLAALVYVRAPVLLVAVMVAIAGALLFST